MNEKTPAVIEYTASDLTVAEDKLLNSGQLNKLLQKTPKNHTYTRPAKGGGTWTYVTGVYVKKMLNILFAWDWDFEVVNFEYNLPAQQAIVHGKLTVRVKNRQIVKHQFGRADIKFKNVPATDEKGNIIYEEKNGKKQPKMVKSDQPLDLGNDLKAATTDALKKCASEFGIASDIYGAEEFKEIKVMDDDKANDPQYWKHQVSEAIGLCQDPGVAEAWRRDAIELDQTNAPIEAWRKLLKKITK